MRTSHLYTAALCALILLLCVYGAPARESGSASGPLPEETSSISEPEEISSVSAPGNTTSVPGLDASASASQAPSGEGGSSSGELALASSEDPSGGAAVSAAAPEDSSGAAAVSSDEPAPEAPAAKASSPVAGSVPAQAAAADLSYFDDAAFIGNSLVDGFRLYSGVKNCDYYAGTSMTIFGIGDYISRMSSREYGKIYMLLGINEIGYNKDKLIKAYSKALDRLINDHPNALIYIMGVSPVTAKKDASGSVFTMDNIRAYNERLLQLAKDKNCCYIDLCDALAGEDGYLPSDVSKDGVHFIAAEYEVWRDYLLLHYVPVESSAETPPDPPAEDSPETPVESAPAEEPSTPEGEEAP